MHLTDSYYLLKFTMRLNNRGDSHQNPINLTHAYEVNIISWPIFQVAIDWIVASDRGPRPFCTPSARGHSFKRALPYHIKVEILLHPVGSAVKLFSHFHDVERVQGIHYRGTFYASCKRQKLKDYISRTQPLLNTFPARSLQLIRPLMNTQT